MNRRPQIIALVLLLLAALGLWWASRMTWAEVVARNGLSLPRVFETLGADWSPWLVAVAAAMLAAGAVQFAVRGWALRLVAILVAIGGVVSAVPAVSLLRDGSDNRYAADVIDIPGQYEVTAVVAKTWPGVVVLVSAALAVLGAVAMSRAAGDAGMSSKYTSPAARREELERKAFAEHARRKAEGDVVGAPAPTAAADSERELWDSLDNGIDPTKD
ncbi:MAG: Trp biosynthesis-associated membrane protein [Gordonia sp. (in: high G+C Gram-positive bacteria)]